MTSITPAQSARQARHGRGFTLIELLVVVSIIALLVAILLPALGSARAAARNMQCLSNQKQWGIAVNVFVTENKDWLPPLSEINWNADPATETNKYVWYNSLLEAVGQDPYYEVAQDLSSIPDDYIWFCPEAGPEDGNIVKNEFNYAFNKDLMGGGGSARGPAPLSGGINQTKMSLLETAGSANIVLIGEPEISVERQSVIAIGTATITGAANPTSTPVDGTEYESTTIAMADGGQSIGTYRHVNKVVNYVFADGHAESRTPEDSAYNPNKPDLDPAQVISGGLPMGVWTNQSGDMIWGSFYTNKQSPFN